MNPSLTEALARFAGDLGFVACGVASLEPSRHAEALDAWLNAGYGGTMRYLHRQASKRKLPGEIVPGAKVAVVVLENYLPGGAMAEIASPPVAARNDKGRAARNDSGPAARNDKGRAARNDSGPAARNDGVKVAKYARGEDYHRAMMRRLGLLADWLRERGATVAHAGADIGPVPERELAQRAGLGWIGKNTMLIRPRSGSFCLIGSVLTDLPLEPAASDDYDRCGTCTRCIDACPTGALTEPRVLDATRCISYLTIESRLPVPEALAGKLEGWGFGCDICNDVCPWNLRFAGPTAVPEYQDRQAIDTRDPGFFERMSEPEFAERFGDTPLERPGLSGMRRNWAAAFSSLESQ